MSKISKYMLGALATAMMGSLFTSCEDDDIYSVNAPSWLQSEVDRIAAEKAKNSGGQSNELQGMMEDVYTTGNEDYTSGFWTTWTKYYVIPEDTTWNAVFDLKINPDDNTYYKNFALYLTNDVDRGGDGYTEYGAFRYDFTNDSAAYNSIWGGYLWFKFSESDAPMAPVDNKDATLQKMGGKVTLSVSRKPGKFGIKITNGTVTKTYNYPYNLPNLNADAENKNIRCFLVPEGSYINWLQTNIEPIGGCTSADDKQPLSMTLNGVPKVLSLTDDMDLNTIMEGVTATVTYEEGVEAVVKASDLIFTSLPDLNSVGKKTLVAVCAKTFKGAPTATPVIANASFDVVAFTKIVVDPVTVYFNTSLSSELTLVPQILSARGIDVNGVETQFNDELVAQIKINGTITKVGETTLSGDWNGLPISEIKVNAVETSSFSTQHMYTSGYNKAEEYSPEILPLPVGTTVKFSVKHLKCGPSNWNTVNFGISATTEREFLTVLRLDNWMNEGKAANMNTDDAKECNWNWDTFVSELSADPVVVEFSNVNGVLMMSATCGERYQNYSLDYPAKAEIPTDQTYYITLTGDAGAEFIITGVE